MNTIKVLVHVADWQATDPEHCTIRAEIVARFGKKQRTIRAYDPCRDIEVSVEMKFVDWWDRSEVFPLYIGKERLRFALERINLFPL